jgi:hypothetical protein
MRRLAGIVVLLVVLLPGAARAAYAPVDHPGPALQVPQAKLAASLTCSAANVDHATRPPVLLVPGTGSNPKDNYGWNYEPALDSQGIGWCGLTLPDSALDDIQVNGEYVTYAIRTMFHRAGRRIAIIGHSQGGMVPRWALRWWPDTRAMVDDMIAFAPTNHGTTMAHSACSSQCYAADLQQASDSRFIPALNSGQETFAGISYTDVYTHNDEEVQPNANNSGTSSLHTGDGRITNVGVQDICPADASEHLTLGTIDAVAYALAMDALNHDGPADPSRIPLTVCAQPYMPAINPVTGPPAGFMAALDVETSTGPQVSSEPPLACYVTASCPAPPLVTGGCVDGRRFVFHLHARHGERIVRADLYLDGRHVVHLRGRRLTTMKIPATSRADHTVRIVTVSNHGVRRTSVRHYHACGQSPPHTVQS